jgi:thymidine phosphorylase
LLALTGQVASLELGRQRASASLRSRAPRRKWDDLLAAHGADLAACERKLASDHTAAFVREVRAAQGGVVRRCDARTLGTVLRELGAGRFHKESVIQPDVGLDGLVKPGEVVEKGAVLCRVHAAVGAAIATILPRLATAFEIGDEPPASTPLIQEVITDASDATAPASLSPSPD